MDNMLPEQNRHRIQSMGPYMLIAVLLFALAFVSFPEQVFTAVAQLCMYLLALASIAYKLFFFRFPLKLNAAAILFAVAACWGPLQLVTTTTVNRYATLRQSLDWAACLAIIITTSALLSTERESKRFRAALTYVAFALPIFTVLQYFGSDQRLYWWRSTGTGSPPLGPFVNRDHYAAFAELLLPVVLYRLRHTRRTAAYLAGLGLLTGSVALSASRAGAVLTVFTIALFCVRFIRSDYLTRNRYRLVLCIGAAIAGIAITGADRLIARLQDPDPFAFRRELNMSSLHMFSARPLTGWGLGCWEYVYPEFSVISTQSYVSAAHNDWAQWCVEGGLPFGLIMLLVFITSVRAAQKHMWAVGVPVLMVHALVDFHLQVPVILYSWCAVLGAAVSTTQSSPVAPVAGGAQRNEPFATRM